MSIRSGATTTCAHCFGGLFRIARKPSPHVGVIGDFLVDIQAKVPSEPKWDEDVETPAIEVLPGGSAANTARQLAALVRSVTFFSTCSEDLLGVAALSQLRSQKFDTSHMRKLTAPSGACIVLSGPEDRAFVTCYSTVEAMRVDHLDAATMRTCDHLHIGGYFGVRGLHNDAFTSIVRSCRERGATVSLGTQDDPTRSWTGNGVHLHHLLPHLDLLIVNSREHEGIERALGSPLGAFAPALTVVVTCGRLGARLLEPGRPPRCVATRAATTVVDTTGAGDAFAAGFVARWLQTGRDSTDAAAWGNACAACCVQRSGACAQPVTEAEVQRAYDAIKLDQ
mmetsp:Transcript_65688/g.182836  ORF Transcript_65688/g.182836 Transcript_65688/m.182836 type:complete len:338 (-) Transcript_65688:104-1117(-)